VTAPIRPSSVLAVAVLVCAAWTLYATQAAADPRNTFGNLLLGLAVFAGLPVVMGTAMLLVVAVPCAVLGPVAGVARLLTGRATGLRGLLVDLCRPGVAVVPGYVNALRKVRSPFVWGLVLGSTLALPAIWLQLPTA
jgi:hypothetical protein